VAPTEIVIVPDDDEVEPTTSNIVSISPALTSSAQSLLAAYTAAMPKFDFSALLPTFDLASLVPRIDTSALTAIANVQSMLPKFDTLVPAPDIAALMPTVDYASLVPRTGIAEVFRAQESLLAGLPDYSKMLGGIRKDWLAGIQPQIDFTASMQPIFEMLRSTDWDALSRRLLLPHNWPDDIEEKLPALVEMVNSDGIPAAWVPRDEVLDELLSAETGHSRSRVLLERRELILEDCAMWLEDLHDPVLDPVLPTVQEALEACRHGLWRAGAISAVAVVHSIVESLDWVSDRQKAERHYALSLTTRRDLLMRQASTAPLVPFYSEWHPRSGKPRPELLARHVVSHQLGEDQVNERNCIVAVMLMASLLITVYQLDLGLKEIAA
jgi:hypothetical protein